MRATNEVRCIDYQPRVVGIGEALTERAVTTRARGWSPTIAPSEAPGTAVAWRLNGLERAQVWGPNPSRESTQPIRRQLVAILAADIAGYSRLIERDDLGTVLRIRALRRSLIEPRAVVQQALMLRYAGDGILMAFRSAVSAVECAVAVQGSVSVLQRDLPSDSRFRLRMGIDLAEVLVADGDLHGDGVNVAARLESLAEPGEIFLSGAVFDQLGAATSIRCEALGERKLKNIERPVHVYRIAAGDPVDGQSGSSRTQRSDGLIERD